MDFSPCASGWVIFYFFQFWLVCVPLYTVCSSGVCLCTVCSLSSGSAYSSGCMVNDSSAMAASRVLLLLLLAKQQACIL